jgi:hypothetical protein
MSMLQEALLPGNLAHCSYVHALVQNLAALMADRRLHGVHRLPQSKHLVRRRARSAMSAVSRCAYHLQSLTMSHA